MTAEQKRYIDGSTYEVLLHRWRHSISGDELLQGETGEYYSKVMFEKRDALPHPDQVNISKGVGW